MTIINHKNIIKLIDTFENEEYIFIVMEHMKGGNLKLYFRKKNKRNNKTECRRNIIFT